MPFADLFNHKPESPAQARQTDALLQAALRENKDAAAHARSGEPW